MDITKQILQMNKRLLIGLVALAVALALSLGAQGAKANEPYTITGEQIDVSGFNYRGTILEDVKMYQDINWRQCQWVNGGYNSGRSATGELQWFYDSAPAKICHNPHSPTTWVKVAGGQSGRNCGNPYKPNGNPPGPVVTGQVTTVGSFEKMNMHAVARAEVNLSQNITCPDGSTLNATSSGLAEAKLDINRQMLARAQGNTDNLEIQLRNSAKAQAVAKAQGNIQATCGSSSPPPEQPKQPDQPVNTTPVVVPVVYQQKPPAPKPEKPAPKPVYEAPKELPNTGPGAVVATFIGVSSLASFAYSTITRRLGL